MFDTNWELINGDEAHEIEVLNQASQANVIEALVRFFLHHRGAADGGCPVHPNENALKELHRTATFLLLQHPGTYREEEVHVEDGDGNIVHTPPPYTEVEVHMAQLLEKLTEIWPTASAIEVGSFTLWLVNWVHPFKNGNGRSARAFCYTCVSLKMGFVLPGSPTIIESIMQNREEYYAALRTADAGFTKSDYPDLDALNAFLERLLVVQLEGIAGE